MFMTLPTCSTGLRLCPRLPYSKPRRITSSTTRSFVITSIRMHFYDLSSNPEQQANEHNNETQP